MAKQPIAKVGQKVLIDGYMEPFTVREVALASVVFPFLAGRKGHTGYAYKCKPKTGRARWFMHYEIRYVVTYQPESISITEHADLVEALPSYEFLRDYLETLDKESKGRHKDAIRLLKQMVEDIGMMVEGGSAKSYDARKRLEELLQ